LCKEQTERPKVLRGGGLIKICKRENPGSFLAIGRKKIIQKGKLVGAII